MICVKLSLVKREYLASALSVLTNSLDILHITNRDFCKTIALTVINKYGKGAVLDFSIMFGCIYHVAL